jgi:hypothetical protein
MTDEKKEGQGGNAPQNQQLTPEQVAQLQSDNAKLAAQVAQFKALKVTVDKNEQVLDLTDPNVLSQVTAQLLPAGMHFARKQRELNDAIKAARAEGVKEGRAAALKEAQATRGDAGIVLPPEVQSRVDALIADGNSAEATKLIVAETAKLVQKQQSDGGNKSDGGGGSREEERREPGQQALLQLDKLPELVELVTSVYPDPVFHKAAMVLGAGDVELGRKALLDMAASALEEQPWRNKVDLVQLADAYLTKVVGIDTKALRTGGGGAQQQVDKTKESKDQRGPDAGAGGSGGGGGVQPQPPKSPAEVAEFLARKNAEAYEGAYHAGNVRIGATWPPKKKS